MDSVGEDEKMGERIFNSFESSFKRALSNYLLLRTTNNEFCIEGCYQIVCYFIENMIVSVVVLSTS